MKRSRKPQGSALAEMGPALFILLILIFFPMLNLVQIGAAYALANTYHQYVLREVAFRRPDDKDAAISRVNNEIDANPLYQFLRITNRTVDEVKFLKADDSEVTMPLPTITDATPPEVREDARQKRNDIAKVRVTTTMTVSPYFTLPFFNNIPGISAPVPFRAQSERPQDEKGVN